MWGIGGVVRALLVLAAYAVPQMLHSCCTAGGKKSTEEHEIINWIDIKLNYRKCENKNVVATGLSI